MWKWNLCAFKMDSALKAKCKMFLFAKTEWRYTGSAAFCRRMSCLPSDRDGLLMHKYYRGDLYETANIYCNRILSGENRG